MEALHFSNTQPDEPLPDYTASHSETQSYLLNNMMSFCVSFSSFETRRIFIKFGTNVMPLQAITL
jgi:hypothetical protein